MDRRELLNMAALGAAAATGAGSLAASAGAHAATQHQLIESFFTPRGVDGRHTRLGSFDVESRHDFTKGFSALYRRQIRASATAALDRVLEREGLDPTAKYEMGELLPLIDEEPAINIAAHSFVSNQRVTWRNLQQYFHQHADKYLSEMEAADRRGPGVLELSATMAVPEHTRHQIHIQPGGYVGDPFAGYMYHYGTNSFYFGGRGHNNQDQLHKRAAANIPVPPDGKVRRILDYGCGIGQLTMALKERFPDAEVWGLDIGAPMIRYGHLRGLRLGIEVNFVQRLAEDMGFPDGYFDIVTSYLAHHEMPADVSRKVLAEVQRVTRPGAVFYPVDFISGGTKMIPRALFGRWWDHRWNNERWSLEYHAMDFNQEIAARGFNEVKNAQPVLRGFGIRHFTRV